jgi:hypothetical protein
MPIYSFRNTNTQEEFTEMMSYDDKVKYLEENPHIISIIMSAPFVGYNSNVLAKAGNGWAEVQNKIKKGLPSRYRDNIKTK